VLGVKAFNSPRGFLNGVPFLMFFFLATVTILAAVGDVRVMRLGVPRGGPRLARHLWRMCFALFIAAGSFFSIRARVAKILPEPFTTAPMRAADPAGVWRDVLLTVEGPRPPHVASARPARFGPARNSREVK
jgi:nitrate/nitrite transporter NarK